MKKNILRLHADVLPKKTLNILDKAVSFLPKSILGGGTATALLLGHRRSYDLDFFIEKPIPKNFLEQAVTYFNNIKPIVDSRDELSFITNGVKISVIFYPFRSLHRTQHIQGISLFDLRDLATNKAYTIGRRGAWRDYIDLFFILQSGISLECVINESKKRFGDAFSEKLFFEQLLFVGDINDFEVDWLNKKYKKEEILYYFSKLIKIHLGV